MLVSDSVWEEERVTGPPAALSSTVPLALPCALQRSELDTTILYYVKYVVLPGNFDAVLLVCSTHLSLWL